MPQTIDVTGVGLLEFPDDMSDEEISKAIQSNFPAEAPNKSAGQTIKENAVQVGIGGTKGFFDLGRQFNAAGEAFFNLPTSVQRIVDPVGPLRDVIGNLIVGEKNLASPFMRNQLGESADLSSRWSQEKEQLGASLGGSKAVRDLSAAGTSLIPSLAAGPLGLTAMSGMAGLQSFGGQFKDTQEFFEKQGLTKEEASKGAIAPALASGAITGLITKAFGATGVEGILNSVKTGTFKTILKDVAKGTVLEGIEEGADQIGQSIVQKFSSNPNLTLEGAVGDVIKAAATGATLGGGVTVTTQTSAAIEKARRAGLNKSADELAKTPPPVPATPPPLPAQEIKVTEEETTPVQTTVLESGTLSAPTVATTPEVAPAPFVSWLDVLDQASSKIDSTTDGKILGTLVDRFKKGDRSAENLQNMASLLGVKYDPGLEPVQERAKMEKVFGPAEQIKQATQSTLDTAQKNVSEIETAIQSSQKIMDQQTEPDIREVMGKNIRTLERQLKKASDELDVAKTRVLQETVGTGLTKEERAAHAKRLAVLPKPSGKAVKAPVTAQATASPSTPSQPINVAPTPTGGAKMAPVEYLGEQAGPEGFPPFSLYNLTEAIPGHPKGSTVAGPTLIKEGYTLPERTNANQVSQTKEVLPGVSQPQVQGEGQVSTPEGGQGVPVVPESPRQQETQVPVTSLPREGMGGASPSEFIPPNQGPTSNKNRVVDEERVERGLPPVMATIKKSWGEAWDYAMSRMDRNPNLQDELIGQLKKKPRPLKDWENVIVLQRRADLRNEYEKAIREGIKYFEAGDPERTADAEMKAQMWSDKLSELEEISKKVGSESGRSLAARRMMMNEDYSLASITGRMRAANGFKPLTQEETAQAVVSADKIAKAQAEADTAKTEDSKVDAEFVVQDEKVTVEKRIRNKSEANSPLFKKIFKTGQNTLDLSRSFLTSFDISAPLRQGKFLLVANPRLASKSFSPMIRAMKSEKGRFAIDREIMNRPSYPLMKRAGLFFSEHGVKLENAEEAYKSKWADLVPGVAASERGYSTFLNRLRADMFDSFAASFAKTNAMSDVEAEAIANFINVATGRGGLGKAERASEVLSSIFFSPRYVTSRFQLMAGQPVFKKSSFRVKAAIAKEYGKYLTGMMMYYAAAIFGLGATVEWDRKSSDFGKIKIGNTGIDPLAGLSQTITFTTRMITEETKDGSGRVKPLTGERVKYGAAKLGDVGGKFVRSKLSPWAGASWTLKTGEDFRGQPASTKDVLIQSVIPISHQNLLKGIEDQGIPRGIALEILSTLGEGVSTYDNR